MGERSRTPGGITELQQFLIEAIREYVVESPLNRLRDIDGSPIWEEPLVGFADGDDPFFQQYRTVVGEFHLMPREVLAAGAGVAAKALPAVGVVSWVLPVARRTRESNRRMAVGPSRRWNNSRFQGEDFNDSLRHHVVSLLRERGRLAVAPVVSEFFKVYRQPPERAASTWSERHIAHAAGLGTFGLSDGLITAKGMAHRLGSVVTDAAFFPTPRVYTHHMEYCLHWRTGECGECIRRCPAGAITAEGHDKAKCREWMWVKQAHWVKKPGFIGAYSGCGLCQTKVPCESRIPRAM